MSEDEELETIYVAALKSSQSNEQSEKELKNVMLNNYLIKSCFVTDNIRFPFLSGIPAFEEVSDFFERDKNSFKKETEILCNFSENSQNERDLVNFCRNSESKGRGFYLMRLRSEYQQGVLIRLKEDGWPHKLIGSENSYFKDKNKLYLENLHEQYEFYSNSIFQIQRRNNGKIAQRGTEDGESRHQYFLMMKEIEGLEREINRKIN